MTGSAAVVDSGTTAGVATHCPYCALQCAMTLTGHDATGLQISAREFPTNRKGLCRKGWTAPEVLRAPDRLTTPLIREPGGGLLPTDWDTALDHVAERVRILVAESGPQAVAVFGGGGLTNEKAYALGVFARAVLRTPYIDYNGRFCMSSAAAAGIRTFGLDRGLPFPLTDLAGAGAVLLIGSNPAQTMPPAVRHLAPVAARGGLIVVDPRRTPTAALAEDGGGLHLQAIPGTDLALVLGLLHVVIHESLADAPYIAARTTGFPAVQRSVATWWPERVERVSGIPAELVRAAARRLAGAAPCAGGPGGYVITGRGAEQHTKGTDTVSACIDLALALGLPGRLGSGYGCLTGQGNGQGGREHGQKADQLPGYRRIDDPAARAHVAAVWGMDPGDLPGPGVPAVELLSRLGSPPASGRPAGPRALFVHGANPVVSAPDATAVESRLRSLDLLVVCDVVPSETALLADVVLPVTQWAEEDGTLTSLEGRVLRRRRAVAPPPGVRSDLEVLAGLADRLGRPGLIDTEPARVFAALARASAGGPADYSGIDYGRLDAGAAVFWPCPATGNDPGTAGPRVADAEASAGTEESAGTDLSAAAQHVAAQRHPGTPRLFLDRFATPDGRARFVAVDHRPVDDDLRPDAPLFLVTGRLPEHYQSGAQTRRVPELVAAQPEPFVQLHPDTAARLGVEDGRPVRLTSRRGVVVAVARISAAIRTDTVFLPFHWSGPGRANTLTNPATDPVSGMPEFKVCAVAAEPADAVKPDGAADCAVAAATTREPIAVAASGKAAALTDAAWTGAAWTAEAGSTS
ncbi:MAG TPA: molybdopterin oxidoreductase family protein [Kineosporiaceae bacterium]|nr:molybdopterin oxidoreductase family protein [Kineosporiaceae bacterium]